MFRAGACATLKTFLSLPYHDQNAAGAWSVKASALLQSLQCDLKGAGIISMHACLMWPKVSWYAHRVIEGGLPLDHPLLLAILLSSY